jgi:hypothetical protein
VIVIGSCHRLSFLSRLPRSTSQIFTKFRHVITSASHLPMYVYMFTVQYTVVHLNAMTSLAPSHYITLDVLSNWAVASAVSILRHDRSKPGNVTLHSSILLPNGHLAFGKGTNTWTAFLYTMHGMRRNNRQVFLAHDCRVNLLKDLQHIQKYKLRIGFSAMPVLGGVAARQMR